MSGTIDNTLTTDDEFSEKLSLFAEMPYTAISKTYKKTIAPAIKGAGVILGMFGFAYLGNKIKDNYNEKLARKATEANDINWEIYL